MTLKGKIASLVDKITPGHSHNTHEYTTSPLGDNHGMVYQKSADIVKEGVVADPAYAYTSDTGVQQTQYAAGGIAHTHDNSRLTNSIPAAPVTGTSSAAAYEQPAADMVCVSGNVAAPVPVGEKRFTVTEDHAVEKERVERWTEHVPVTREYVTKVQATGEVFNQTAYAETGVATEQVLDEHTCYPVGTTTVSGVAANTDVDNRSTDGRML